MCAYLHGRANGLRYRRGELTRLLNIIAPNLANRASESWGKAPSGARFVSRICVHYNDSKCLSTIQDQSNEEL